MERTTDDLLAAFRTKGEGRLEDISFELAVAVVSDILGLTNSPQAARAKRIERAVRTGTERRSEKWLARIAAAAQNDVLHLDVLVVRRPAGKETRGSQRLQDDVISHLLSEKYSDKALLIECLTYGSAGMMTTREFIVMAAWYLFEQPELRERYLASDAAGATDDPDGNPAARAGRGHAASTCERGNETSRRHVAAFRWAICHRHTRREYR